MCDVWFKRGKIVCLFWFKGEKIIILGLRGKKIRVIYG